MTKDAVLPESVFRPVKHIPWWTLYLPPITRRIPNALRDYRLLIHIPHSDSLTLAVYSSTTYAARWNLAMNFSRHREKQLHEYFNHWSRKSRWREHCLYKPWRNHTNLEFIAHNGLHSLTAPASPPDSIWTVVLENLTQTTQDNTDI